MVELAPFNFIAVVLLNWSVMLYPVELFVETTVIFVPVAYPPVRPAILLTIVVADVVAINEISPVIDCETVKLLPIALPTDGSNAKNVPIPRASTSILATNALRAECSKNVLFINNNLCVTLIINRYHRLVGITSHYT